MIITGWVIIFGITVGLVAFHPSFREEGFQSFLRIGGFALIPTLVGILLLRFTDLLGRATSRTRKLALAVFILSALPLIPVALATFGMPWGALIIITLLYVRWKWALVPSSN